MLNPIERLSTPFPPLLWSPSERCWSGTGSLAAWAGSLDCSGAYGAPGRGPASDGSFSINVECGDGLSEPTAAQSRAFAFHALNGEAIFLATLAALKPWYDHLRPKWLEVYSPEEMDAIMPEAADPLELRTRIGLHSMHVHVGRSGDMAFVGLELGCTWDEEHGAGVLMIGQKVVKVGAADIAFSWLPQKAEFD